MKEEKVTIQWGRCTELTLNDTDAECGLLSVPLDHSQPHGTKIQIALARIKHTVPDNQFQGAMLFHSKGPDIPDSLNMPINQYFLPEISKAYDWIRFNPRGSGISKPALSCLTDNRSPPFPDYVPLDQTREDIWLNRSKTYADACGKKHGKLLRHMTSADMAKDMEQIRMALGQEQISFWGNSGGTYMGQLYATLYPKRVRRMILDSNVDSRSVWFDLNMQQNFDFDRNIQLWFQWLAQYNRVYHLGDNQGEVEYRWKQVLKELETRPASDTFGPSEWVDLSIIVALGPDIWDPIGEAFAQWVHHKNASILVDRYQRFAAIPEPVYAVYLAVTCTDAQWPRDWNHVRTQNWRSYATAPVMTWNNAWLNGPCLYWPSKGNTPIEVDGSRVNEILLLGGTLNALNRFTGSFDVRRRFPQARLVSVRDGIANAVGLKRIACVDDVIAKYLASGELPPRKSGDGPDVVCEPPPKPVPAALH